MKSSQRQPTQKDVATHAGVSQAAVSSVLSGDGVGISPAVQERIRQSAAALNYVPNRMAQALKTNRTMMIACIVPDLSNPFYPPLIRAVQKVVEPAGYDVIALSTDGLGSSERGSLNLCLDRRVAGIVGVFFVTTARELGDVLGGDIPVVRYESAPKRGGPLAIDDFYVDNQQVAFELASQLVGQGHRRIVFMASPGGPERARITGYSAALAAARLTPRVVTVDSYSIDGGAAGAARLLADGERPSAIMCADDLLACGAIRACQSAGLVLPRDMSITGFNNLSMTDVLNPSLTTVALGQELFGQLAGERLLARIRGEVDGPGEAVALPFSIVARASTAPPPEVSDNTRQLNSAGNAA
ncbi:LacI family DNA-binding transcriptional regulator [Devosia sp. A16]|uniref:LacI family DNA-binding transcriptional regulator n=1 Tax=Devosia sp. A16 TaxID=1736675 RepID=UPI0006D7AD78|nr:LacI family DNA-binding transcriptional regulator [Devosia sp. A16]